LKEENRRKKGRVLKKTGRDSAGKIVREGGLIERGRLWRLTRKRRTKTKKKNSKKSRGNQMEKEKIGAKCGIVRT